MEIVYILSIMALLLTSLPKPATSQTTTAEDCPLWEKFPGKHQTDNPIQTRRFQQVSECKHFCERMPVCATFDSSTLARTLTCFFYRREGPTVTRGSYVHWRKNTKCQLVASSAGGHTEAPGISGGHTEAPGISIGQRKNTVSQSQGQGQVQVQGQSQSQNQSHPKVHSKCYPGRWVSTPGVRAKYGTLLNTVPASTVDRLCKTRCLAAPECVTLDTISSVHGTQCFANHGEVVLEKKLNYIHWEYQTRCKTASGKAFVFKYLGSYTISSGKNYTKAPAGSKLQCLGLCADSPSCRVASYNRKSCYQIPNLQEALHAKWVDKGSQMFEKTELRHRSLVNGVPPDYCIPEKSTKVSVTNTNNNTWERPQICWLGLSNQTCTFSYAGRYTLKNTTDLPKPVIVTNRTQCLLKCSESPTCAVAAYSDTACVLVDRTTVSRIPRTPSQNWTEYYKDSCRIPSPTSAASLPGVTLLRVVLSLLTARLLFSPRH